MIEELYQCRVASPASGTERGEKHAVDYCYYSHSIMVFGHHYIFYYGRIYTYPARSCRHRDPGKNNQGEKGILAGLRRREGNKTRGYRRRRMERRIL